MHPITAIVAPVAAAAVAVVGLGTKGFPNQQPRPLLPQDKTVSVLGSTIRYRDIDGPGTPIVFIHGSNLSLDYWVDTMAAIPGRRLVAVDLIGFGGSDKPDLTYDIDCHQRYFLAFMDALGIDAAILVGHSFGGVMAAWFAAKSPERVVAPVIMQAPGIPGSMITKWPKSALMKPGLANRLCFGLANSSLFKRAFPRNIARQDLGLTNSIFNQAYVDAVGQIRQPTLLLMSSGDNRIPFDVREEYLAELADAEFGELPYEAGHIAPRTYGAGSAALIAAFLERRGL